MCVVSVGLGGFGLIQRPPHDRTPLHLGRASAEPRQRAPSEPAAARGTSGRRGGRRATDASEPHRREWEEERELLTCTAIDVEVKRVAIWSAVYLQDSKAAANPCRAVAAAAALALERSRRHEDAPLRDSAAGLPQTGADTDVREGDSVAGVSSRSHPLPAHRMRVYRGVRKLSPSGAHWLAFDGFRRASGASGESGPSCAPSTTKEADGSKRNGNRMGLSKAAEEVQHLTALLGEVWTEDWLSVSLPSPPPFGGYVRAQEGRVLLLPVLLRAAPKTERGLLQRRLEEAQSSVDSEAFARQKERSAGQTSREILVTRG